MLVSSFSATLCTSEGVQCSDRGSHNRTKGVEGERGRPYDAAASYHAARADRVSAGQLGYNFRSLHSAPTKQDSGNNTLNGRRRTAVWISPERGAMRKDLEPKKWESDQIYLLITSDKMSNLKNILSEERAKGIL